jgi:methionyl-tRNA formyltransferase
MAPVAHAYLGTSDFAATVLGVLVAAKQPPALVVTPPDRRAGRGRRLTPPPVATLAVELGLPLHQTASVNEPASIAALRASAATTGTVCAFGQLIAEPLLGELPMLNVHPSLLPRWRGAAPVERAIMAGDERTGVAIMRLTEGLDSGPVALQEELPIEPDDTYGTLAPRLAQLGGELLARALAAMGEGDLAFSEQSEDGATYAEKIGPEDRRLDPRRPARELELTVRALTPHIGAFFELADGERLGIRAARALAGDGGPPGTTRVADGELIVACGAGELAISTLQPPGKRAMPAADWLRGHEPPARVGAR